MNHPPPSFKYRTQSSPFIDTTTTTVPPRRAPLLHELLTESCRSISDPDLTSITDKERCSTSSGECDLEYSNTQGSSSLKVKSKPPYSVRYSDNSLERPEVCKILESLENVSSSSLLLPGEQNGGGGGGSSGSHSHSNSNSNTDTSSKKRAFYKGKNKPKHHNKDVQKVKRTGRVFHSSDDILEHDKDAGRRSSSGSPQEVHSPIPTKKKSGTGILKFSKKKKNSVPARPSPTPLEDPFCNKDVFRSSPVPHDVPADNHNLANGHGSPNFGDDLSPRHNTMVSFPESKQQEPDSNFNLQTLILPENPSWVKCGYLWLRMKLPNGRYAWTHIVSDCGGEREIIEPHGN